MNFNQFVFSRERRNFGRQCLFSDRNEPLFDQPPNHDHMRHYILRNPVNQGTQLSDQKGLSEMNTENVKMSHHGMYHYEGGWPKDVNFLDEEQTIRHRKKIERDDIWGRKVMDLTKPAIYAIQQNSAVNIYQNFFSDIDPVELHAQYAARPVNVYHDPLKPQRNISQLDWSPGGSDKLLALYSNLTFFEIPNIPRQFYIWDVDNPLKPLLEFTSPLYQVNKALFCPRDEHLIAGGLSTGMPAIWDARTGGPPVGVCPLEASHNEPISALCWVHSKSNMEFYTGSTDGTVYYWDGRNLNQTTQEFRLDPVRTEIQQPSRTHGCTVLEFEYTIPVKYMAASDRGRIFIGNRKGMTPMETFTANFKAMSGPIKTVERNPFFVKNFLVIGDWGAKIWTEECKDFPIIKLDNFSEQLNCGVWSTTRCSLFFTGGDDCTLDFWDLLMDFVKPIFSIQFKAPITSIRCKEDGRYVAVALADGDFFLVQLDDALTKSAAKDRMLMAAMFEREFHRCKLMEGRIREIHLKAAQEEKERLAREEEERKIAAKLARIALAEEEGSEQEVGSEEVSMEGFGEEEMFEGEEAFIDPDPEFTNARRMFAEITQLVLAKRAGKMYNPELTIFDPGVGTRLVMDIEASPLQTPKIEPKEETPSSESEEEPDVVEEDEADYISEK